MLSAPARQKAAPRDRGGRNAPHAPSRATSWVVRKIAAFLRNTSRMQKMLGSAGGRIAKRSTISAITTSGRSARTSTGLDDHSVDRPFRRRSVPMRIIALVDDLLGRREQLDEFEAHLVLQRQHTLEIDAPCLRRSRRQLNLAKVLSNALVRVVVEEQPAAFAKLRLRKSRNGLFCHVSSIGTSEGEGTVRQTRPTRSRSCMCRTPIGRFSSSTKRLVMRWLFIKASRSAASASGFAV